MSHGRGAALHKKYAPYLDPYGTPKAYLWSLIVRDTFVIIKKIDKNLMFKKNKSKRRALIKREATNAEDIAKRR